MCEINASVILQNEQQHPLLPLTTSVEIHENTLLGSFALQVVIYSLLHLVFTMSM